jgi:hypothetical protein
MTEGVEAQGEWNGADDDPLKYGEQQFVDWASKAIAAQNHLESRPLGQHIPKKTRHSNLEECVSRGLEVEHF